MVSGGMDAPGNRQARNKKRNNKNKMHNKRKICDSPVSPKWHTGVADQLLSLTV